MSNTTTNWIGNEALVEAHNVLDAAYDSAPLESMPEWAVWSVETYTPAITAWEAAVAKWEAANPTADRNQMWAVIEAAWRS